ncbi:MAG: PQQ-binding-like beta-propeller repeat protein [Acidobacteria bacterium]|nr:PQQ-binding-like beta-propeller repeat protein [Acidobacteriota bacterium]
MGSSHSLLLLTTVAVAAAAITPAAGENWPQWRGPTGQGVSSERHLPLEWSPTKNIAWKTPIPGRGHSQPIVWGDRLFLTTAIEGPVVEGAKAVTHVEDGQEYLHPDSVGANRRHTFKVLGIDAASGKVLWEQTAFEGTPYDNRHKRSSFASSTPAADGRRVYAFFGTEGIYAFDFSGALVWKKKVGDIPTMGMGTGTSPVLYENLVILQCDEDVGQNSFIVALDRNTGVEVWRTPRKVQTSWATPIVVSGAGRDELITSGTELVIAYDPATGRELWQTKGVESNAIPTPVFGHGMVYITAGFPAKRVIAIRLGGTGDITSTHIAWRYDRGTAYVPSPILYGDYLYLTTDRGLLTCIDAKTGEVKYEGARVPVPATFMGSMVAFDGKLLQTSEDGDTFVIKTGAAHEVLRTNSIGEPVYSSPAVANGRIFIRAEKHLYSIAK